MCLTLDTDKVFLGTGKYRQVLNSVFFEGLYWRVSFLSSSTSKYRLYKCVCSRHEVPEQVHCIAELIGKRKSSDNNVSEIRNSSNTRFRGTSDFGGDCFLREPNWEALLASEYVRKEYPAQRSMPVVTWELQKILSMCPALPRYADDDAEHAALSSEPLRLRSVNAQGTK